MKIISKNMLRVNNRYVTPNTVVEVNDKQGRAMIRSGIATEAKSKRKRGA